MKPRGEGAALNGFLDKGSHLKGELTFEETFRIDGKFEGRIPTGGELVLGDSAEVDAEIRVERVASRSIRARASPRTCIHPFSRSRRARSSRAPAAWRRIPRRSSSKCRRLRVSNL